MNKLSASMINNLTAHMNLLCFCYLGIETKSVILHIDLSSINQAKWFTLQYT